jgi:hypothetical protein
MPRPRGSVPSAGRGSGDHPSHNRRASSRALESGGVVTGKRAVLLSLSRLCGRVCIVLLSLGIAGKRPHGTRFLRWDPILLGLVPSGSTWHRPYQPDQRHQDEARTNSRKEQSNFSGHVPPVGINSLRSHSTVGKVLVDALGGENWGFLGTPWGVRGPLDVGVLT